LCNTFAEEAAWPSHAKSMAYPHVINVQYRCCSLPTDSGAQVVVSDQENNTIKPIGSGVKQVHLQL